MKLRGRLLLGGLVVLLVTSAGAVAIVLLGARALESQAFDQLRSVREAKALQIETEITQFIANLGVLAEAPTTRDAIQELSPAFERLGPPIDTAGLDGYYAEEFAPRVVGEDLTPQQAVSYQPGTASGRKLQDLYISGNPWPVGRKDRLYDAEDGSRYSAIHAGIHPFFRSAQESFGAYDIFLIDADGTVLYSVFKEVDVGTDLKRVSSGLADAWRASRSGWSGAAVTDFEAYLPSYNAPAAFAAQSVTDSDGVRIGTVAMQLPVDRINSLMTSEERWNEVGLGESGETYLIGEDFTMRNDSRFLIEDPDSYFEAVDGVLDPETVELIRAFDSTIALQSVETVGTREALDGEVGEQVFPDYRGVQVLSSYRPLELGSTGLNWAIMSEIDRAEAFSAEYELITTAAVMLGIVGVGLTALIFIGSGRITRPLGLLEAETETVESFDFTGPRPYDAGRIDAIAQRPDEIGDLAGAFSRMTSVLGENIKSRSEVEAELNVAAEIQESMLPLTFPSFPDHLEFQIHARLTPAKEIGGDFFEHGFVDDDHFFFTVGDVSGKGVPAALFMSAIKTLIRSGALQGESPAALLTRINQELSPDNPEMMFATVWLGIIDLRDGVVTFTNGGHNPPARVNASGVTWIEDVHGPMVGPIPGVEYEQTSLALAEGEMLVVFSDGVTEAMSPDGTLYGEQRLAELLDGRADQDADAVTGNVVDDVIAWEAGSERSDDVTVMVMRFLSARRAVSFELRMPVGGGVDLADAVADDVSAANGALAGFARENGFDDQGVQRAQVAVDDILTNIAAYSGASAAVLRAWMDGDALTIEISDDGSPYDPLTTPIPDIEVAMEDREVGGLGIHLVRNLMDEVAYRHVGERNVITMTVNRREEQ
jgi:serine phosphatase RsbU (regulator of sigma subunit)/anti-sigma regulatory factor (Ser/Thr protein kinase)